MTRLILLKKKCGVLFQESLWIDLNTIEPDNETPNLIQNSKNLDFEATKPTVKTKKFIIQNSEVELQISSAGCRTEGQ